MVEGALALLETGLVGTGRGQAFFTAGVPNNVPLLPDGVWPLWFVASAFGFSRRFGMLFMGGLILDTILRLLILPALQ